MATLLAGLLLLTACAAGPPHDSMQPGEADPTALAAGPSAVIASLESGQLHLRYVLDGTSHHVSALLDTRESSAGGDHLPAGSVIRRLAPSADHDAAGVLPGDGLAVRDALAWRSLLEAALDDLVPARGGLLVDVLDVAELFAYRDSDGAMVTVPQAFRPPGVTQLGSIGFAALLRRCGDLLRRRDGGTGPLLFVTDDVADRGYPFVLADPRTGRFAFLRNAEHAAPGRGAGRLGALLGTLLHGVTSPFRAAAVSPVSSLARLFATASVTSVALLRPDALPAPDDATLPAAGSARDMDTRAWEAHLDALVTASASPGRLRYHVDGAAFFPRLYAAVAGARESLDLRIYIFDNDDVATRFADLLRRRSEAIAVRVLVDGLGTRAATLTTAASQPPGHLAPPSIASYLRRDSAVRVRTVQNPWLFGDHTKAIVIDGETAFVGGMNVGREYRYDWHDLMVEVDGPVVGAIRDDFERNWRAAGPFGDLQRLLPRTGHRVPPAAQAHYPVRILRTLPGDPQILRAQVAAIRAARRRILLQNAYLTSDAVIGELVRARRRGVDVRVILPVAGDSGLIDRSNVVAANAMLRHGIRVYIYPRMSHVKAAVYDGWACFGSANFDNLSLHVNRELNLATSHPPAVAALVATLFEPDMAASLELREPLPDRWGDRLAELLADFL